jgi:uncharacterized protein (DUF1800 family)
MPFTELTEVLGRKRAAHLLRRTCFGGSIAEIDEFAQLTPRQAVERLFQTNLPTPAEPIDTATNATWMTTGVIEDVNSEESTLVNFFLDWQLGLMTGQYAQPETRLAEVFRERIVYFLHTHFTTKRSFVRSSQALYFQNLLFRQFAFDGEDIVIPGDPENNIPDTVVPRNFKTLTRKVSLDNAMLRFLDGHLNVKGRPNENYARELLELYSIGRGLEGDSDKSGLGDGDYLHFTEQDVQAGARVLSGFDLDPDFALIDPETGLPTGTLKGGGRQHDDDPKEFSFRFGNQVIDADPDLTIGGNPTRESIIDEIDQMIDMIYNQEETPKHICRRLYRFFVYHDVTQQLHDTVIADMAQVFVDNNYKIQPVLETLFTSTYFYEGEAGRDDDFFGSLIKSPIDLVVGSLRTFEYQLPDFRTAPADFYEFMGAFRGAINSMGLDFYEPFEVAGYAAYHQFPIYNRAWISTNYLTNRYNFFRNALSESPTPEVGKIDVFGFIVNNFPLSVYSNPRELIRTLITYLYPVSDNLDFGENSTGDVTDERLSFFLQQFLYKQGLEQFDSEEDWTNFVSQPDPNRATISERFAFLLNALLQTPEFQLM